YMPGAECLHAHRREPRGILHRAVVGALTRASVTNWYRLSSAGLEWRALRRLSSFEGVLHIMWADRDWGFLDLFRNRRRHRLCCTFHGCPDTLSEAINFPRRLLSLDAIILMSTIQRGFFEQHGVPAERLHVILHGVDTEYFHPAEQERADDGFFEV